MTSMRIAVLGLIALAACAGCATGTRSVSKSSTGMASPAPAQVQRCEGWYDAAAGVCDTMGS